MRATKFFFHYNKPASLAAKEPRLSVHFKDTCFIVKGVQCNVPCRSKIRKRQPRCVMEGRASHVEILPTGDAAIWLDPKAKTV